VVKIICAQKYVSFKENSLSYELAKEELFDCILIGRKLNDINCRVAYLFMDPLIDSFEAANRFFFSVFDFASITKLNTYKSGAGPIQAIFDAKELIESGKYDAAIIAGYEPLLTSKRKYGKEKIEKAMQIFEDQNLMACYNDLARRMSQEMGWTREQFLFLADKLYENYLRTYSMNTGSQVGYCRGKPMDLYQADWFRLTDCANPNIDFCGCIIVANDACAESLKIDSDSNITIAGAAYRLKIGSPNHINDIIGNKKALFYHLQQAVIAAQEEAAMSILSELEKGNLLMEAYTCYPPIPIAFLLTIGQYSTFDEIVKMLEKYSITITGGMNFSRAPWNNPAFRAMIDMYHKMKEGEFGYGVVHGNGGIGEAQGVVILKKDDHQELLETPISPPLAGIKVGMKAEIRRKFTIDEVRLYAKLSRDTNPIHLDDTYAARTIFGKRIVHGVLVASQFGGIFGSTLPGKGAIHLGQTLRFSKPIFVDEEVKILVEVIKVRTDKPVITLRTVVEKENGEIAIEGEAVVKI